MRRNSATASTRRRGFTVVAATTALVLIASAAWGAANLGTDDVAVVGAASASPGAVLTRTDSTTFDLSVEASDGNIGSGQCSTATTGDVSPFPTFTVTSAGLVGSGTRVTQTLDCPRNFSQSSQQLTFADLDLIAGATAPLGSSSYALTFGDSTEHVQLGNQVNLQSDFSDPTVFVTVNPRAASNLDAQAASASQIDLTWTASPDAADITSYVLSRDGVDIDTGIANSETSYSDSGLDPDTEYCYTLRARYTDGEGTHFDSAETAEACATTEGQQAYVFTGFYAPVDLVNKAKAGQGVPLKWNLYEGSAAAENEVIDPVIGADSYALRSRPVDCDVFSGLGDTVPSDDAGKSELRYDYIDGLEDAAGQNVFVWKTNKQWAGTCREVLVSYDGSDPLSAIFSFTR